MRRRCALARGLAPCLAACLVAAEAAAQRPVAVGRRLAPTGAVRLYGTAGSITVEGWDRDSVHVEGEVAAGLAPYVGGTPTAFKFSTYEGRVDGAAASHLTVWVPRRAQLWVKVMGARLAVRGATGSVELYTIDGPVRVDGTPTDLTVESMRGDVTVRGAPGWLRARSGTGTLVVQGAARDLALATTSGDIRCAARFALGRLESVRGAITLAGPLEPRASVDIDAHAGPVTVRLPATTSAAVTVYARAGRIAHTLGSQRPRALSRGGTELALTLGRGDARLAIRAFSGDVHLLRDDGPARP